MVRGRLSLRSAAWLVGLAAVVGCAGILMSRGLEAATEGTKAPEFVSATWLNSPSLRIAKLRGHVVLVEFWTFGCYNCRHVEPYVKAWHQRYASEGLVVIGVHTPESDYERDHERLEQYVRDRQLAYPVVLDDDFAMWTRYGNGAWPSLYLIDKRGVIQYAHVGEGRYGQTEQRIQELLAEP